MESKTYIPNESLPLKNLITVLEKGSRDKQYNITFLCESNNVKRRALYDFIVIASAFHACYRKTNNEFEWRGLRVFQEAIPTMAKQFETECVSQSILTLFDCSNQPTLAKLAVSLIQLFAYLHENIIDIRQAAKLFAQKGAKYKTMLRKLYTVISCLEVADVVSRTNSSAEIKLLVPFTQHKSIYSIQNLIQTKDDSSLSNDKIYETRRVQYKSIVGTPSVFQPQNVPLPSFQPQAQSAFSPLTSLPPNVHIFPSLLQITPFSPSIDHPTIHNFLRV
jgi:hypothetical protein